MAAIQEGEHACQRLSAPYVQSTHFVVSPHAPCRSPVTYDTTLSLTWRSRIHTYDEYTV